jgi:poly(glycerol-phosphate) alpha-glucosyltransferase
MTSALLERSRGFATLGGRRVDILTFDPRPDYAAVETELRDRGELLVGMRLLNMWDWLRDHRVAPAQTQIDVELEPLDRQPEYQSTFRDGIELTRSRLAPDESVMQIDYYREDGSLLAIDRKDTLERGTVGGRSVVLCDERGNPARSWNAPKDLYRYWIDVLAGEERTVLFIDSKTTARHFIGYSRPNIATVHVVHSSHLVGTDRPFAALRESRRAVFEHLDGFDAVIVLTDRQRGDIEALLGKQDNVYVVPNSRDGGASVAGNEQKSGAGIVVAVLSERKRVDHAVRAIASARVAGAASVTLDVYGDGDEKEKIEALVDELGERRAITFHGYDPFAREAFGRSSFALLTSTSEGFPLVLVEAMASGCVPIAYDIPYGPADIIDDTVNGYLVPAGDENALARAIVEFTSLDPKRRSALRTAAIQKAARFTSRAVTRQWATVLREVFARKRRAKFAELTGARAARRIGRRLGQWRSSLARR